MPFIIRTQKEINVLAKNIRQEAAAYLTANEVLYNLVARHCFKDDKTTLFAYCVTHCQKPHGHLIISHILDTQPGAFANQHDETGNTLHHYAAIQNYPELMHVLNEQKIPRICFITQNKQDKTPLDLCCELGNEEAFAALWARAGKDNHNPSASLLYACHGQNKNILLTLLHHPKTIHSATYRDVLAQAEKGQFAETVNQMVINFSKEEHALEPVIKKRKLK